nr:hypothetical protein [Tanacetum cinerariifolium]
MEKSRKRAHSSFRVLSIVCTTDIINPKKWLKDEVICELNVRVFKLETIIKVLHFNDEFSSLGREFMDSLNILFQDLIQQHYSDEDICNEKNIIEEQRFRVEEAKRMSTLTCGSIICGMGDLIMLTGPCEDTYDYEWRDWELMKSISETQLKVLKKISFIAKLRYNMPNMDEVVFKIHKNGYFEFDPLRYVNGSGKIHLYITHKQQDLWRYYLRNMVWVEEDAALRCSSSSLFSTRIKRKKGKTTKEGLRKKAKGEQKMVDDEPGGRKSVQTSRKRKEIMY